MTTRTRMLAASATLAAALSATVILTGCAAGPPSPSQQPAQPAVESPAPNDRADVLSVGAVVVTSGGLSTRTVDGAEVGFLPYGENPAQAIAELTAIYGAQPTILSDPGDQICSAESTTYTWAALSISVLGNGDQPPNFWVSAGARSTPVVTVGGAEVVLETENGGRIGGSAVELLAKIPDGRADNWMYEGQQWTVFMERTVGEDVGPDTLGVRIYAIDDSIVSIHAPVVLNNDC